VLYGISAAQLSNVETPLVVAGRTFDSFSKFLELMFDYHYNMRWWCVLIVAVNMVFYRVLSILALRYFSFLKR